MTLPSPDSTTRFHEVEFRIFDDDADRKTHAGFRSFLGSPVYGAPLRLRVENQLGYKMVNGLNRSNLSPPKSQWANAMAGKNADDEYFDLIPEI